MPRPGRFVALVLGVSVAACGASVSSPDPAHVAQTAADPRTDDPTASQPVPIQETPTKSTPAPASPSPAAAQDDANEPAAGPTPRVISARHVLIQWMGSDRAGLTIMRSKDQALALAQDVLKKARAGQDLGKLAIEYSDEPNAGARAGSLGRFQKGQMIPAFEEVAFKLKVGQISGIVETGFGYHIIQRTE